MEKITNKEIISDRYNELDNLNIDIGLIEDEIKELEAKKERRIFRVNNLYEEIDKLKKDIKYV